MLSYREGLARIGVPPSQSDSYAGFPSRPKSLRTAIQSMSAPSGSDWLPATETKLKSTSWTNQCQGVAFDGEYWIFSGNSSTRWGRSKGLWAFRDETRLGDGDVAWQAAFPATLSDPQGPLLVEHVGQLTYWDGRLYVSHFNGAGAQVLVFVRSDSGYRFERWIPIGPVRSPSGREDRAEFQTINPWDGKFYTSFGTGVINEFFIHEPDGTWTGEVLPLDPPILPSPPHDLGTDIVHHAAVQGACFTPNGHLFVSSNSHPGGDESFQCIRYYSALNGRELGVIRILANRLRQELEGICWANGAIRAVLLDVYPTTEADDVFFKRLTTRTPDLI
jgi:hypothetical protein